ncbi:hypothetical protein [Methanosarcina sp.]|uniref:hypothetical protein n=1 Tax=Methanosarcina sp. TaxID=2213 RepID=UPI002ABB1A65|nr:hypothetical protein [Methanosarcina sp.]MDY9926427.1 hypothetical protein [Methanosarcina sp.]
MKLKELITKDIDYLVLGIDLLVFVLIVLYLEIRGSSLNLSEWIIICIIGAILILFNAVRSMYEIYIDVLEWLKKIK